MNRFGTTVDVEGSFVPGGTIVVKYRVEANLPTEQATIRVIAPEMVLARRAGWKEAKPKAGESLPPELETVRRFASRELVTGAQPIRVEAAGYYRIGLIVEAKGEESISGNNMINNVVSSEIWVYVAPQGGRVTKGFDPAVLPDSAIKQPGPLRFHRAPQASLVASSATRGAAATRSAMSGALEGIVWWLPPGSSSYEGVGGAAIRARTYDTFESRYITGWTYYSADAAGHFSLPCPNLNERVDIELDYADPFARMIYSTGTTVLAATAGGYYEDACNWPIDWTLPTTDQMKVWQNASKASQGYSAVFGGSRSVDVQLGFGADKTGFYPAGNRIRIIDTTTSFINGQSAVFYVAHEYGHAVHYSTGRMALTVPTSCDEHGFASDEDMECAWREGFANFFAVAVRGSAAATLLTFDANGWGQGAGSNGSRMEGPISSFLWDLYDGPGTAISVEAHDNVQFPASYILSIIQTCSTDGTSYSLPNSRVDQIIYCMENQVDATLRTNYFVTAPVVTTYSESALEPSGWSQSVVRAIWKKNLYNQ